ncbi:hypothetical protein HYU07_04375 [Candidatus Woesearchaeota archaeon]|nr:hypothetical protein [Candidatus Woesearchaeota archaeon]
MARADPKNIVDEAKRQITGTKTPSRKRLIYTIIVIVIFWLFSIIAAFYVGMALTNVHKKVDVDVYIDPYLNVIGEKSYIPLIVENTGDTRITNGVVSISTCYMNDSGGKKYYEFYETPPIQKESKFEVKFANKQTIESFKKKNCSADINIIEKGLEFLINFYSNETQEFMGPVCGICYYDVIFESDQINKKFINSSFPSPIDLQITIKRILNHSKK